MAEEFRALENRTAERGFVRFLSRSNNTLLPRIVKFDHLRNKGENTLSSFHTTSVSPFPGKAFQNFLKKYRYTNGMVRHLDALCTDEWGTTYIQTVIITALLQNFKQPHEIARNLGAQSQTVTGVLDRMEKAGFVERHRDLTDLRAVRLALTTKASMLFSDEKAILEKLDSFIQKAEAQVKIEAGMR